MILWRIVAFRNDRPAKRKLVSLYTLVEPGSQSKNLMTIGNPRRRRLDPKTGGPLIAR